MSATAMCSVCPSHGFTTKVSSAASPSSLCYAPSLGPRIHVAAGGPKKSRRAAAAGVSVRAAKAPPGVEPPKELPKLPEFFWGFTENAEVWNSRAAMIGIIGILVVEFVTGQGILELLGFEVGKGLDIPL